MKPRVLFLLKRREDYCNDVSYTKHGISTGLLNSATFVHDMLLDAGIESNLVIAIDNNDIDREVTKYKPTHVIIEALWVVPEKFEVLAHLHPHVKWIVRFHSETPFIASEGIAMTWLQGYMKHKNVIIAANAPRFLGDIKEILAAAGYSETAIEHKVVYLPNYYPVDGFANARQIGSDEHISIGCFGAIRPLKNHLIQAIGALRFANRIGRKLHFHINTGRIEMKGDPILHNLIGLFAGLEEQGHKLVMHQWMCHAEFMHIIRTHIDIGMQVAFSETFNIVSADLIVNGVPIVVSREVPWAAIGIADPEDSKEIAETLLSAYHHPKINVFSNTVSLKHYVHKSKKHWEEFLLNHH